MLSSATADELHEDHLPSLVYQPPTYSEARLTDRNTHGGMLGEGGGTATFPRGASSARPSSKVQVAAVAALPVHRSSSPQWDRTWVGQMGPGSDAAVACSRCMRLRALQLVSPRLGIGVRVIDFWEEPARCMRDMCLFDIEL